MLLSKVAVVKSYFYDEISNTPSGHTDFTNYIFIML